MSSSSDLGSSPGIPYGDKLAHFVLYAVLGAALAWGRHAAGSARSHAFLLLLAVLYGLSDEWHQSFVPGRDASAGDLLADALGAAAGYLLAHRLLGRGGRRALTHSPPTKPVRDA